MNIVIYCHTGYSRSSSHHDNVAYSKLGETLSFQLRATGGSMLVPGDLLKSIKVGEQEQLFPPFNTKFDGKEEGVEFWRNYLHQSLSYVMKNNFHDATLTFVRVDNGRYVTLLNQTYRFVKETLIFGKHFVMGEARLNTYLTASQREPAHIMSTNHLAHMFTDGTTKLPACIFKGLISEKKCAMDLVIGLPCSKTNSLYKLAWLWGFLAGVLPYGDFVNKFYATANKTGNTEDYEQYNTRIVNNNEGYYRDLLNELQTAYPRDDANEQNYEESNENRSSGDIKKSKLATVRNTLSDDDEEEDGDDDDDDEEEEDGDGDDDDDGDGGDDDDNDDRMNSKHNGVGESSDAKNDDIRKEENDEDKDKNQHTNDDHIDDSEIFTKGAIFELWQGGVLVCARASVSRLPGDLAHTNELSIIHNTKLIVILKITLHVNFS